MTGRSTLRGGFDSHALSQTSAKGTDTHHVDERLAPALETEAIDEASLVEPGRTSTIAALGYRDFRLFWFGLTV